MFRCTFSGLFYFDRVYLRPHYSLQYSYICEGDWFCKNLVLKQAVSPNLNDLRNTCRTCWQDWTFKRIGVQADTSTYYDRSNKVEQRFRGDDPGASLLGQEPRFLCLEFYGRLCSRVQRLANSPDDQKALMSKRDGGSNANSTFLSD